MHGFALLVLGLVPAIDSAELSRDVEEIQSRKFTMPLRCTRDSQDKIERIRLFVSEDQGKTWKHKKDYKPTDERVIFTAPHDGLYWFALQAVYKDGESKPAELEDLVPAMKVYVNAERKSLKVQKSYEELQREVEELQKIVEQLQKRIKELELDRKRK